MIVLVLLQELELYDGDSKSFSVKSSLMKAFKIVACKEYQNGLVQIENITYL